MRIHFDTKAILGKRGKRRNYEVLGFVSNKKAEEVEISNRTISPIVPFSAILPWILPEQKVDLTLMGKKKDTGFNFNSYSVQQYINNYYNYVQICTDSSKNSAGK